MTATWKGLAWYDRLHYFDTSYGCGASFERYVAGSQIADFPPPVDNLWGT